MEGHRRRAQRGSARERLTPRPILSSRFRRKQIVVSHLVPGTRGLDVAEIEEFAAGRVAALHEIAFDPHLAGGGAICADELAPTTSAAYRDIIEASVRRASGTLSA